MPPRRPPPNLTIASLIEKRQALVVRCVSCDTARYLSPLEAIGTYGGQVGFEELTAILRKRCGDHCGLNAEPSIRAPDELVYRKAR
jgi:hypothetical protein